MSNKLPIGTRIRFIKTLDSPATGDHPAFLYARVGELGAIVGHDASEGYMVTVDSWRSPFGATWGEEFVEHRGANR